MSNFTDHFKNIDKAIMSTIGDDITFITEKRHKIPVKCILSARPGTGNKPGFESTDNIWAKIDIYSTPIEVLENTVPGIAKTWTAFYKNENYSISEVIQRGNNTLIIILYRPGSHQATIGGWK